MSQQSNTPEEMEAARLKVRARLRADFDFYAANALKIRPKEGLELIPFRLNQAQRYLHKVVERQLATRGMVRIIILKGRQQGLSTYVEARLYHALSQTYAAKGLVMAHKAESSKTLFEMTQRYHKHVPEILRPHTKYSSKRELAFDELDSSFIVATAGGDGVARGETLTHLHASEIAFWPASTSREIWSGLEDAIPASKGSMMFIESTANGMGNLFHDLWKGAVNGENGLEPVFIPWYWQDEYREEVPDEFIPTPEEIELQQKYGLDLEQLQWRRTKIGRKGAELFKQEYPFTAKEAFLTSGRPVFVPETISDMLESAPEPIERLALEGDTFKDHPSGELKVYRPIDPGESYVIGADVGSGIKGALKPDGDYENDPSVAQVLDQKKNVVATWRGHVEPDFFATVLYHLGERYNWAEIGVENNNHGGTTVAFLAKVLLYPFVYQTVQHDKTTDKETVTLGFTTNVKTKPLIINELRADVRDGTIWIPDAKTLNEMLSFIETESGKMEAEPGNHDDTVMALAIANHIHAGISEPIKVPTAAYTEGY